MSLFLKSREKNAEQPAGQTGTCEMTFVNRIKVEEVRKKLKPDSIINQLAESFKALGDSTRLKIIYVLSQAELCVCDMATLLGLTDSAVSHQLRVLRNMRLVKYRKEGKMAYYTLDDEHIENLFREGLRHVEEKR